MASDVITRKNTIVGENLKATPTVAKLRSRKKLMKLGKYFTVGVVGIVALIAFVIYAHMGLMYSRAYLLTKWYATKKAAATALYSVPPGESGKRTDRLIEIVNRVSLIKGVNPLVTWAIVESESGFSHNRERFEPGWKEQYSGKPGFERENWMTDREFDQLYTSYGYMQVGYGLWRKECNIKSFDELLDPERNIDCGLTIMSKCLNDGKQGGGSIDQNDSVLRTCFRKFNGSGKRAEEYADRAMRKLSDYMIVDMEQKFRDTVAIREAKQQVVLNRIPDKGMNER